MLHWLNVKLRQTVCFFDLDSDHNGNLALYKLLALLGAGLAVYCVLAGLAGYGFSFFIATMAASFGRNTFIQFLKSKAVEIEGDEEPKEVGGFLAARRVEDGYEETP